MEKGQEKDYRDPHSVWEEITGDPGASDPDGSGVGASGCVETWDTDSVPCRCGCGTLIPAKDRKGRPRKFVLGHQIVSKEIDYNGRALELNAHAPLCACGCGERLSVDGDVLRSKRILNFRWRSFLAGHNTRKKLLDFTADQRTLLLGTLLGDSSILYPYSGARSPRISFNHGPKQEQWARYKAERLPSLRFDVKSVPNCGYGTISIRGSSVCHPHLVPIFDLVNRDGKKCITTEWLDALSEEAIAWWYMDDGSLHPSDFVTLHTEGYSRGEVDIVVDWFRSRGYSCKASNSKGKYWIVLFKAESSRMLVEDLAPYAAPGMEYKFRLRHGSLEM